MGNPLTIYHSIKSACYNVSLSPFQASQMHQDIAALKLSGQTCIGVCVGGATITYLLNQIPYVGPLLGLIVGVISATSGIIGYDLVTAANNLSDYANHRFKNLGKNLYRQAASVVSGNDTSEEKFALELFHTASKNTLVISTIYNLILKIKSEHT